MKQLDIIFKFLAYEGQTQTNDPADADKISNRIQDSEIAGITRYQYLIADTTSDQAVNFPNSSCDLIAILIDRNISIKLNGWSTPLALQPKANGKKTLAFFTRGTVTGLTVSNASGAAANLDIIVVDK